MIAAGAFLWHAALSVLLLVIWRLSVRLGRAMRDDVGPIALLPVSAGLLLVGGLAAGTGPAQPVAPWIYAGADLLGAVLGWYAAWHSWGWLRTELRRKSSSGG
jgi:hypothetical protein